MFGFSQQLKAKLDFFKSSIQYDLEKYSDQMHYGICECLVAAVCGLIWCYFIMKSSYTWKDVYCDDFMSLSKASEKMLKAWQENEERAAAFAQVNRIYMKNLHAACDVYQYESLWWRSSNDSGCVLQVAEVSHLDDEIMALHSEIVELQRSPYARRQGDKMEQLWVETWSDSVILYSWHQYSLLHVLLLKQRT